MPDTDREHAPTRLAGYAELIKRYDLEVISNWHMSAVAASGIHRVRYRAAITEEVYPPKYWPGDTLGDHLEFALKYDGTNLAILAVLFATLAEDDFLAYVLSKPTGKYARRLWFLYEFLTGKRLPLDDLKHANYVDLLDPNWYYTVSPGRKVRRQRVNDNLLGNSRFCPTVRRSDVLRNFAAADLASRCRQIVSGFASELLQRSLSYLYTKETRSSFEIENIKPSATRTERFVALLQLAEREDFCRQSRLIELQNRIVDARFRDSAYRRDQNYVATAIAWQNSRVHFVSPKPEDLSSLMEGLIATHQQMENGAVSAFIQAAAISYGFVFLHPFEDGNGRIHRFLIHNILARRGITPEGVMVPISAAMLNRAADYEASLEAFSRELMLLVDYTLASDGRLTVHNDTAIWYRYLDLTPQAEALYRFFEHTIDTELAVELRFLANYDAAKKSIQNIVDMPDRMIDLFIRFCLQNNGRLSSRKRASHFDSLAGEEIAFMERAVQSAYGA